MDRGLLKVWGYGVDPRVRSRTSEREELGET